MLLLALVLNPIPFLPDAREVYLGEDYYNANLPIIQQRLVAAGVRLGTLLNNIFSGSNVKVPMTLAFERNSN